MKNRKGFLSKIIVLCLLLTIIVSVAACTQVVEFKVNFIVDGEIYKTVNTAGEEAISLPADPTKNGYIFDGWYWDEDVWSRPFTAESLLTEKLTADMSVYAKWINEDITKRYYTVTFNSFGGSDVESASVLYGKTFAEPTKPTKAGYVLVGWYKEADLTTKWNFATDVVTEDITLYAKWVDESDATGSDIIAAEGFGINGTMLSIKTPNSQEYFALSNAITVSPYATWTVTTDIAGKEEIPSGTVALEVGDNTYYINVTSGNGSNKKQYTVNIRRREIYTLTYVFNNGDKNAVMQIEEDGKPENKQVEKTGYTFVEWKNGENAWAFENDVISGNTTLEAVWSANEYDVTFDSAGGNAIAPVKATYDSAYSWEAPEKTGYTFLGWKAGEVMLTDENGDSLSVWKITENTKVVAMWEIITYNIIYDNLKGADNHNVRTYTVEDEVIFAAVSQDGYTFIEWQDEDDNVIEGIEKGSTGNRTIKAVWDLIPYTVTFVIDGEEVASETFNVETQSVTEPAIPEKTGYSHAWEDYDFIAQNITVNAVYTPIVYNVTYIVEGEYDVDVPVNDNPVTYTIEDETIILKAPSKTGYNFVKWTENGEEVTEIAAGSYGDKTITAQWEAVVYTLNMVMENEEGDYDGHYDGEENRTSFTVEDEFAFISPVCDIRGYEFKGWYTLKNDGEKVEGISLGTVGSKTFYARWQRSEYTITYYNIDSSINSNPTSYNVESETFTLTDPSRIGYTFVGWYSDADLNVVADTTVETGSIGNLEFYAKWTPTVYTITYVLYDGVNSELNPSAYTIEDEITLEEATKEGYSFGGWFTDSSFENGIETIALGSTGNTTLYAKWYYIGTVTFETNGGSTIDPITQEYGTVLVAPEDPEREHYTFAGWYSDEELHSEYVFGTMPDVDFTLYAKWTAVEYNITYVLNGGENGENPEVYTVESAFELAEAIKTGYTFVAWYTQPDFTGAPVSAISAGTYGDMTLYANYSINSYTISFDSAGGSSVTSITQDYDTAVSAPADPSRTGYSFNGWLTEDGELFVFDRIPAHDVQLTADWKLIEYTINYNLSGGVNNASNPAYYTIEDSTIVLAEPTRRGYEFVGWFKDSDYSQAITEISAGSYGVIDVEAKWEIIVYTITYENVEGLANPNPTGYTVEQTVTFEEVERLGYTFGGFWQDEEFTIPATGIAQGSVGNVTVYAKYTVNTYEVWLDGKEAADYTVSFDLGEAGGRIASQHIVGDTALVYPEVPERSGYLFGGWYQTEDCTGTAYDFTQDVRSDVVLYAKWVQTSNSALDIGDSVTVAIDGTALHYYDFVPLVSGDISVTTTGSVDTFGYLYDEDGTLLRSNDDGGDSGNFLIKYNVTAGEKYTIAFRGYGKASSGTSVLVLSGNNTVTAGGKAAEAGVMQEITFDTSFTLPVPNERDGYIFRGWADEDGVLYTDETGASIRNFDKAEETILYSFWEVDGFDITFVTNGGSEVETVTIPHGGRVDINSYVTTRSGYSFLGWYLSASDSEPYNASVMPDYDITLYAKWTAYALDSIKYDESIKAATSLREITADDFGATCFDNGGNQVEITVSMSTQTAGETAIVRLTATSNGKTRTATIQDVRIYDAPTLDFDDTVAYFNLKDGLTADWFTASGSDTYGEPTIIEFEIEGDYAAGDVVTVIVKSVDPAGNVTSGSVENVKVYGLPVITFDEEKGEISVDDELTAQLLSATAVDSFGEDVEVTVTLTNGTIKAGNTVTLTLTAVDQYGNTTVINKEFAVYGAPTISDAQTLEFRVEDEITPDSLGITAEDTYGEALDISLIVKEGEQQAGVTMIWTATVTDIAGNVTTKDYSVRIYGTPVITYDRDALKVTEDPTISARVVTFDLNGASGTAPAPQTVTDTVGLEYPAIPTRSGYVFAGWYDNASCSGTPYDFTADIEDDITLYAKWISYSGNGVLPLNGSITVNVVSKSSSTMHYYAFVPLVSGSVTIYSYGGLSDTYGYLYNSNKTQLDSDDDDGEGNNFLITYNVTAGQLYYIRPCGYSSSGTTTVYLTGAMPSDGGCGLSAYSGAKGYLNAYAYDSFGSSLEVTASVESGQLVGESYITYILTATDHLGNVGTITTAAIPVYDAGDIQLSYDPFSTSDIKLTSKGEEFNAIATDTFGEECEISIERVDGGAVVAGEIQDIVIVATDKAGNRYVSDMIANIGVYDMPVITYAHEYNYIYQSEISSYDFMFTAADSFGEELYVSLELLEQTDDVLLIKASAEDNAGNITEIIYELDILFAEKSYLALYFGNILIEELTVVIGENYNLPSEYPGFENFKGWTLDGKTLTDASGTSLAVWDKEQGVYELYADAEIITYNVVYYLDGGVNNAANPSSYTVETLGGADGSITLAEPAKAVILSYVTNSDGSFEVTRGSYTFLGWYSDGDYQNGVTSITLGLTALYAKWSLSTTTTTTTEPYVRDGDTVYFGSYPQTKVTDTAITSALGGFDSSTWTSYGYYVSGSVSNYMYYIDKEYGREKYRGVYFTSYRPYLCPSSSSASNSLQDGNGYATSTVYWFRYEPIAWKIVNEEGGKATLVADLILDSQQYDYKKNGSYSNDYAESTIRAWLNDTFYNTAFSEMQQAIIQTTEVDNSVASTGYSSNPYACENTYDRIFLMSYVEAITWFTSAAARQRQGSDYAKSQGLLVSSSYAGNSDLWLRSPDDFNSRIARSVIVDGSFDCISVDYTYLGVLPALVIKL